ARIQPDLPEPGTEGFASLLGLARHGGYSGQAVIGIVTRLREVADEFLGHPDHQLATRDVTDLGKGIWVQLEALDHVLARVGVQQCRRVVRRRVLAEES